MRGWRSRSGVVRFSAWSMPGCGLRSRRGIAAAFACDGRQGVRRWLDTTARAAQVLAAARSITVVSDRESDIYEHFAYRPANTHLIVRACQNRKIRIASGEADALLFGFIDGLPEVGRFCTKIPAAPGRKAREAELAVRLAPVVLCKPQNGAGRGLPDTIDLVAVDVREVSVPADGEPVRWRLLTTHPVTSLGDARRIVDLYRMRWTIEEFFRTLKSAGFDIEEADISEPRVMTNFMTAAAVAAVTIMQLVKARDGTTDRLLADAFEPADQPVLEAVSARLEGKTVRQRTRTPQAPSPSLPGSSLASEVGPDITASQAPRSCAAVSTTFAASGTAPY